MRGNLQANLSDFYRATYKVTPAMLVEAVGTIAATVETILDGCQENVEPTGIQQPEHEPAMPRLLTTKGVEVLHV